MIDRRAGLPAWLRLAAGLTLAMAFFLLGVRGLDWADLHAVLVDVRWPWLVAAWFTLPLTALLKTLRWRCLLVSPSQPLDLRRLGAIFVIGQFVNAAIPARLGELSRAYLVNRFLGQPLAAVLGSIALEKLLDGLVLLGLVALLAVQVILPPWFGAAATSFAVVLGCFLVLLLLALFQRERLMRWADRLPRKAAAFLRAGLEGLTVFMETKSILPACAYALAIWVAGATTNYLVFRALGMEAPLFAAVFLVVAYYLAVLIPGVPAQIGLFHYVTVLALGVYAIEREISMPYAIALHGLIYGTILLLGVIGLSGLSLDLRPLLRDLRSLAGQRERAE